MASFESIMAGYGITPVNHGGTKHYSVPNGRYSVLNSTVTEPTWIEAAGNAVYFYGAGTGSSSGGRCYQLDTRFFYCKGVKHQSYGRVGFFGRGVIGGSDYGAAGALAYPVTTGQISQDTIIIFDECEFHNCNLFFFAAWDADQGATKPTFEIEYLAFQNCWFTKAAGNRGIVVEYPIRMMEITNPRVAEVSNNFLAVHGGFTAEFPSGLYSRQEWYRNVTGRGFNIQVPAAEFAGDRQMILLHGKYHDFADIYANRPTGRTEAHYHYLLYSKSRWSKFSNITAINIGFAVGIKGSQSEETLTPQGYDCDVSDIVCWRDPTPDPTGADGLGAGGTNSLDGVQLNCGPVRYRGSDRAYNGDKGITRGGIVATSNKEVRILDWVITNGLGPAISIVVPPSPAVSIGYFVSGGRLNGLCPGTRRFGIEAVTNGRCDIDCRYNNLDGGATAGPAAFKWPAADQGLGKSVFYNNNKRSNFTLEIES